MNFQSVDDIYTENDRVRKYLLTLLEGITEADESMPSENGKWTLSMVVEHMSDVEKSMSGICSRLLSKAAEKGIENDGTVTVSQHFIDAVAKLNEEGTKLTAPEIVQPKGGRPISESVEIFNSNRERLNSMRDTFKEVNGTVLTFPHPAFGNLTAIDWLVLIGGHEARHTAQIERILARKDAAKA